MHPPHDALHERAARRSITSLEKPPRPQMPARAFPIFRRAPSKQRVAWTKTTKTIAHTTIRNPYPLCEVGLFKTVTKRYRIHTRAKPWFNVHRLTRFLAVRHDPRGTPPHQYPQTSDTNDSRSSGPASALSSDGAMLQTRQTGTD